MRLAIEVTPKVTPPRRLTKFIAADINVSQLLAGNREDKKNPMKLSSRNLKERVKCSR